MDHYSTIEATCLSRLSGGLGDLLLAVYDAGWMAGSGQPCPRPQSQALSALLDTLRQRHMAETDRLLGLVDSGPPRLADELPSWLLKLASEAAP